MARTLTFSTCKHMLLLVALLLLPLAAQAVVFQYGSLFYETSSDGTAKVVANPNGSKYSGNISIYSAVMYGSTVYVVRGIGSNAFYACTGLTSVVLPEYIESIGDYAFAGCTGLTSLTIPDKVKKIGAYAFQYCNSMTSLTFNCDPTSIGENSFLGCNKLTQVTLNNNNFVSRGRNQYYAMNSIFGEQVQRYIIGDGVTIIGSYAFYGCINMISVSLPSSLKSIEYCAFSGCSNLTSVSIPNSVTSIGSEAFRGSGLTSVTIPNSVTSIGEFAFYGCTGLTSVVIPNSVTSIERGVFDSTCLTSVTIPNSVTSIGDDAFSRCTGLTSVTIPNSVKSIGERAFMRCTGLTSVTIPNSVTSIGDYAFYDCVALTSVTIPSSVTAIGSKAFYDCTGLTQVTLNSNAIVSENRNEDTSMRSVFGRQVQTYTIGAGVSSIGEYAFYGCRITSMTIPNSVYNIKKNAFGNCTALTTVNLRCPNFMQHYFSPDESLKTIFGNQVQTYNFIGVSHIGGCAFYGCTGIISVNCDISLRHIGSMAFEGCTGLTQISFPSDLRYIDEYAFYGCTGLTSAFIPSSVQSLGKEIFYECPNLTEVLLYSKTIVSANRTNSTSLKTIFGDQVEKYRIGDGVSEIGDYAFFGSSNLKSVIIPSSMTLIGNQSFSHCSELERIDCEATTPPDAFNNTFEDVETSKVLLVVPDGSLAQYKAHNVWKQFWVETPTGISLLLTSPEEEPIYDLSGRRLQKMQRGINIVGGKKVLMK